MLVTIPKDELQRMLDMAAEQGARLALEKVGLHDEEAGADIRDIRSLLQTWKVAKKTAFKTFVRSCVHGLINLIMIGILAGIAYKLGLGWGDQK